MRIDPRFLGLPASLILIIASQTNAALDGSQTSRQTAAATTSKTPVGVLKMSDDPDEKFYMEYWQFDDMVQSPAQIPFQPPRSRDLKEELRLSANSSAAISFRAPFALHSEDPTFLNVRARDAAGALAALQKRAFVCPVGTSDCSAIHAQNSCCPTGEFCFPITDTGLGSVACCPNGQTCGGSISTCQAPNTPCAANTGGNYQPGGCCIPNYVCAGVGCVFNPALLVTVIVTQTVTVGTSSSSIRTSTITSTRTPSTSSVTNTAPPTSTPNGIIPIRPTTANSPGFVFPTSAPTQDTGSCPTGFYACSAYYRGGCCRTGRDCQTTNCPATSSTTLVSGGVTVMVPVGSAAALNSPTGICATGWSSCAPSLGGYCCPTGYECGTASCSSLSPTQTAVVQKGSPNSGGEGILPGFAALAGSLVVLLVLH